MSPQSDPNVPDSISFGVLRKLHQEKATRVQLDNPVLSHEIGDLAFYFKVLCQQKFSSSLFSHHCIFLLDVIATDLRRDYEERLNELFENSAPKDVIKTHTKMLTHLSLIEAMLDGMVSLIMKQMGTTSTLPSIQLVRSMDPTVRPHEVEEWVKSLGSLLG